MSKNVKIIKHIEMTNISNASGKKKPIRFVTNVSPNNTSPTTPLSDITNVNASSSSNALKPSSHSTLQSISHKENNFFIPPNCRVARNLSELSKATPSHNIIRPNVQSTFISPRTPLSHLTNQVL
ncbi:hypothetical protein Lser_V15G21306 [Lactuca serriola]